MSFITVIITGIVVVFEVRIVCFASLYYCKLSFNFITTIMNDLNLLLTTIIINYLSAPTIITPVPPIHHSLPPPYTNNPLKYFLTNKFSISKSIFSIDFQLILPTFLVYQ